MDMKILNLIGGGDVGGAKTHIISLASRLGYSCTVKIVSFRDGPFVEDTRAAGIDVEVVHNRTARADLKALERIVSEYKPDEIVKPLLAGEFTVEDRSLLRMEVEGTGFSDVSLNEVAVHRKGAAVLGVDLAVDGESLPTCWADGFLVATSSGSTAYSLSVGGPICTPDARVLILAPIAPHNLNIRPIVVPDSTVVSLSFRSREPEVLVTMDNRSIVLPVDEKVTVSVAQFSLKRIRLYRSNFIQALKSKLFWGEDVRNL